MNEFYKCTEFIPPKREDYGSDELYREALRLGEERIRWSKEGFYEYWKNDQYAVQVYRGPLVLCHSSENAGKDGNPDEDWPEMIWLSIKRLDREPIMDWRDLQDIKNFFLGEEAEAVQLFPAESRLVDTSNQYHLWGFADKRFRWPFGYLNRKICTPDEAKSHGARQRG